MSRIAVTIDVETDWGGRYPPELDHCRGVREGMEIFLGLLSRYEIKATLFVSGVLVDSFAGQIRAWAAAGHEIASHGFEHRTDYGDLTAEQLYWQVERSKKVLEECTGRPVTGFRTPQFARNPALIELLARAGYRYDSSTVGASLPGRYSYRGVPAEPHFCGDILEIPVAAYPVLPLPFGLLWTNLIGSTGYRALSGIRDRKASNRVFYLHPFDLVEKSWNREMKPLVNLFYLFRSGSAAATLAELLRIWSGRGYEFVRLRDIAENYTR